LHRITADIEGRPDEHIVAAKYGFATPTFRIAYCTYIEEVYEDDAEMAERMRCLPTPRLPPKPSEG